LIVSGKYYKLIIALEKSEKANHWIKNNGILQMKYFYLLIFCIIPTLIFPQNLQLHYDFRHALDSENNDKNFVTFSFETFKAVSYGSLFMKIDADFIGSKNNMGKLYTEISHTFKFWPWPIFLHLQYSGGLGIVSTTRSGYYIDNAYIAGFAYPFQWKNSWFNTYIAYRFNNFSTASHDIQYSFYWGASILNGKISLTGHLVLWTENKNHGDAWTQNLSGKKFFFLSEPQIWYNINKLLAFGSEIKLFYHVYTYSDNLLIYPTLAIKYNL
jgi:hypothetical protein